MSSWLDKINWNNINYYNEPEYQENFVRTEGHDKDKDIIKTKFIWDKGG